MNLFNNIINEFDTIYTFFYLVFSSIASYLLLITIQSLHDRRVSITGRRFILRFLLYYMLS